MGETTLFEENDLTMINPTLIALGKTLGGGPNTPSLTDPVTIEHRRGYVTVTITMNIRIWMRTATWYPDMPQQERWKVHHDGIHRPTNACPEAEERERYGRECRQYSGAIEKDDWVVNTEGGRDPEHFEEVGFRTVPGRPVFVQEKG